MADADPGSRSASPDRTTTVFHIGAHTLRVTKVNEGRWTFTVDGGDVSSSFATQAEAWEAGVRAADRMDATARR